jgi:hypothetical protein
MSIRDKLKELAGDFAAFLEADTADCPHCYQHVVRKGHTCPGLLASRRAAPPPAMPPDLDPLVPQITAQQLTAELAELGAKPKPWLPPGVKLQTSGDGVAVIFARVPLKPIREQLKRDGFRFRRGAWCRQKLAESTQLLEELFSSYAVNWESHEAEIAAAPLRLPEQSWQNEAWWRTWAPKDPPTSTPASWAIWHRCDKCQRVVPINFRASTKRLHWHTLRGSRCAGTRQVVIMPGQELVSLRTVGDVSKSDGDTGRFISQALAKGKRVKFDDVMRLCVLPANAKPAVDKATKKVSTDETRRTNSYLTITARQLARWIRLARPHLDWRDAYDVGSMSIGPQQLFGVAAASQTLFCPLAIEGSCSDIDSGAGNTLGELAVAYSPPQEDTHHLPGGRQMREDPDEPLTPRYTRLIYQGLAGVAYALEEELDEEGLPLRDENGERLDRRTLVRKQDLDAAKCVTEQRMIEEDYQTRTPKGRKPRPSDGKWYPRRFTVSIHRMTARELSRIDGGLFDRFCAALKRVLDTRGMRWLRELAQPLRDFVRSQGLFYRDSLVSSVDDLLQAKLSVKSRMDALKARLEAERAAKPGTKPLQTTMDPLQSLSPLWGGVKSERRDPRSGPDPAGDGPAGHASDGAGPP